VFSQESTGNPIGNATGDPQHNIGKRVGPEYLTATIGAPFALTLEEENIIFRWKGGVITDMGLAGSRHVRDMCHNHGRPHR